MPADPGADDDGGLEEAQGDATLPPDEVARVLVTVYQELLKAQAYAIALIRETEERSAPPTADQLGSADLPVLLDHERRYNDRLAHWQGVAELLDES